jgi:chloramphenicol 3-O phosphotransferase
VSGKILFLHGASSSGKSTLARYLQAKLPEPFWHYSIDHLLDSKVVLRDDTRGPLFDWASQREGFFEGFHRSLGAFAAAGNNLIVEHIVETQLWRERLIGVLTGLDVFSVCLRCPEALLVERERARGDRRLGSAVEDAQLLDKYWEHDLEVDSSEPLEVYGPQVLSAWAGRSQPRRFKSPPLARELG